MNITNNIMKIETKWHNMNGNQTNSAWHSMQLNNWRQQHVGIPSPLSYINEYESRNIETTAQSTYKMHLM